MILIRLARKLFKDIIFWNAKKNIKIDAYGSKHSAFKGWKYEQVKKCWKGQCKFLFWASTHRWRLSKEHTTTPGQLWSKNMTKPKSIQFLTYSTMKLMEQRFKFILSISDLSGLNWLVRVKFWLSFNSTALLWSSICWRGRANPSTSQC